MSYNQSDDEAHFAGMLFRGAPRDYAAGHSIIAYFFETALPSLGLAPGETSIIRKPIIALELARYGLVASHFVETRTAAGLLTPRIDTRRGRPSLHFIDGNEAEFLNPAHEKYYDIVPNRELPYLYPLEKPSRPIDIHTSYQP